MDKTYLPDHKQRTQELLRRLGYHTITYETGNIIHASALKINPLTREVICADQALELTGKEYELLLYLILNTTRIVYREELINQIWGYEYNKKSRTLDIHIRSLRQKLGVAGVSSIKTIRNVGYRFVLDAD